MKRDLRLFIEDILENLELIINSTKKLSKEEFESNRLIIDATIRRLEIIGEAVKNIPISFKNKHKKIPWKKIAGFRDVLIHTYFGINIDRVWEIIKKEVISLKKDMEKLKKEME